MNALRQSEFLFTLTEGLTLETSAFLTFQGGNLIFINSFNETKFLFWSVSEVFALSFFFCFQWFPFQIFSIFPNVSNGIFSKSAFFFLNKISPPNHLKSPGPPGAHFSKVPKLFERISGDIILFVSSKRRRLEDRNFAVIFVTIFIPFTTYEKTSFAE